MSQTQLSIAYQGQPGAYSHLSCQKAFPQMQSLPCNTFPEAMLKVEQGQADLAMLPLENSTAGRVEEIYRLMPATNLHIQAEHFEPVNHCLLGLKGADITQISEVRSHPQALAQCEQNIKQLQMQPIAELDTAGSAALLAKTANPKQAAIASSLAAELYGLNILKQNFQDKDGNTTRFLILSKSQAIPSFEADKKYLTTLMFRVRNIPAALYQALGGFSSNSINMIKLESYMASDTMTVSSFHLDVEAHIEQDSMKNAVQELHKFAENIKVLGCYPAHNFRYRKDLQVE